MHRIIINKLGPIDHAELECNRFMVFTGAQASGKSTVAKALFFFRTIKDDIYNLIIKRTSGVNGSEAPILPIQLQMLLMNKFWDVFDTSFLLRDIKIRYCYTDQNYIDVFVKETDEKPLSNYVWLKLSQPIIAYLFSLDKKFSNISGAFPDEEKQLLKQDISSFFDDEFDTVFIPAGRSIITLFSTQINYIYSTMDDAQKRSLDSCTRRYLENIIKLRPEFESGLLGMERNYPTKSKNDQKKLDLAQKLIGNILKGNYRYNDGNERIHLNLLHYVKIGFASSGQQESLWILNLLYYYLLQEKPMFFIIEEPESHLFPDAQKAITELISLVHNAGHSMLITTHSPYVLGAINNLIYAGQFPETDQTAVEKIIDRSLWIDRERINAWFVRNGGLQSCIDSETGLIQNELIDEISSVINDDFDSLLSIQTQNKEIGE